MTIMTKKQEEPTVVSSSCLDLFLYKLFDQRIDILIALAIDRVPVNILWSVMSVLNMTAEKQNSEYGFCGKLPV